MNTIRDWYIPMDPAQITHTNTKPYKYHKPC